jgi:hypothetical protein
LTGFLTTILGMKDGYYKCQKFSAITEDISAEEKLNVVKIQLMPKQQNKIILIRENKSAEVISIS